MFQGIPRWTILNQYCLALSCCISRDGTSIKSIDWKTILIPGSVRTFFILAVLCPTIICGIRWDSWPLCWPKILPILIRNWSCRLTGLICFAAFHEHACPFTKLSRNRQSVRWVRCWMLDGVSIVETFCRDKLFLGKDELEKKSWLLIFFTLTVKAFFTRLLAKYDWLSVCKFVVINTFLHRHSCAFLQERYVQLRFYFPMMLFCWWSCLLRVVMVQYHHSWSKLSTSGTSGCIYVNIHFSSRHS